MRSQGAMPPKTHYGDTMRTYYGTRKVGTVSKSKIVYVDKSWGLKPNDIVDFSVYNIDDPMHVVSGVKRVCAVGTSYCIFLDKMWGFEKGDLVVYRATPRGVLADTRIEIEEDLEEVPE